MPETFARTAFPAAICFGISCFSTSQGVVFLPPGTSHVMSASNRPVRYQPTYWLHSQRPYNKDSCEKIMKIVVDATMETFVYDTKEAESLTKQLSNEILSKVKKLNFDRYKLICIVTIGEKYMQSFCDIFKCMWDIQRDGYAFYIYDTPSIFAIAVLYAVYLD